MVEGLRERVKRRVEDVRFRNAVVDIETLAQELAAEFDARSVAAASMLSRMIIQECALRGIAMRLGPAADGETHRASPAGETTQDGAGPGVRAAS